MASGQSNMQSTGAKNNVGEVLIKRIQVDSEAGKEKLPVIREFKVAGVWSSPHPLEHVDGGWTDGTDFAAHGAYGFTFAYELYKELEIPIGIMLCAQSATSIRAFTPREGYVGVTDEYSKALYRKILEGDHRTSEHKAVWEEHYKALQESARTIATRYEKGMDIARPPRVPIPGNVTGDRETTWMYNARIHPIVPYAIRGVIQNHGAADVGRGFTYYNDLHNQIRGWRSVWNNPDLPYYFHQYHTPEAGDGFGLDSGCEMRMGACKASRDIPNAGMASQIDIGSRVHRSARSFRLVGWLCMR